MTHELYATLSETISSNLRRKAVKSPSRWAETYRRIAEPKTGAELEWSFKYHPWLRAMHDSQAEFNVGMKSAQMGYSENVLNKTFYNLDIKRYSCLYVLPAKTPDASDFSSARFDAALELSEHLQKLFSDTKNIGHKRAGSANLYIRGSRSRSGLKSIPVNFLVLDELEEFEQENVPLAIERTSGQYNKEIWAISTPRVPKRGIHRMFLSSTQEHFFFPCPSCKQHIELDFKQNVKVIGEHAFDPRLNESYLFCHLCNAELPHANKWEWLQDGEFVKSQESNSRGFYINQLYSSTVHPADICKLYFQAQTNPAAEQEFFNSKMGLPHAVEGAQVSDADIEACVGDYASLSSAGGLITLGIDVGINLHYEVAQWTLPPRNIPTIDLSAQAVKRVIKEGKVLNFEQLDLLMYQYGVLGCVIDCQPERRKAFEFACRFPGRVYMCFYAQGVQGRQMNVREEQFEISVDRTSWMDLSLGRFKAKTIRLPRDVSFEYREHIKAPVRVPKMDKHGNPIAEYDNGSDPDHFAHASTYSEIALMIASKVGSSHDMSGVL